MEGLSESSRLLGGHDDESSLDQAGQQAEDSSEAKGSERFDLYFGGLSFVVDAIAFTAIGLSKTKLQLYLCGWPVPSKLRGLTHLFFVV